MHATLEWQGRMAFTATDGDGHTLRLDAAPAVGGENSGFRPKQLLLDALGGCTAMDVISILTKMGQIPDRLRVEVTAEEVADHPKELHTFHLRYEVQGTLAADKLRRAVELSQQRYCPVSAMFGRFTTVTYTILLNDSTL